MVFGWLWVGVSVVARFKLVVGFSGGHLGVGWVSILIYIEVGCRGTRSGGYIGELVKVKTYNYGRMG